MGFFSKNAICCGCNKEVGLNRFQLKQVTDGWLCAECMKKCGGIAAVNVKTITLAEIQERLKNSEEKESIRQGNFINAPLQTSEGMYKFCLDNSLGEGFSRNSAIKHFKLIEDNLLPEETVELAFIGIHNYHSNTKHDNNYAYAVTNLRIVMGQKQVVGEKFQTVSLENINDITLEKGMIFGVITIDTKKEKFNIAVDKKSSQNIFDRLHDVLFSRKGNKSSSIETISQTPSDADEILKFKKLLDQGIITEDEFAIKKKQLLGL